jgi:hypothetical protein
MADASAHTHDFRYKTPLGQQSCWCGMPKDLFDENPDLAGSVGRAMEQAVRFAVRRDIGAADDETQAACEQKAMDILFPALEKLRGAAMAARFLTVARKGAIDQLLDALDDNTPDLRKWEEDAAIYRNGLK